MKYTKTTTIAIALITLVISSASAILLSNSEGGHTEDMFNKTILGEWWYLNGNVKMVSENGTEEDLAFYTTLAHQEDNRSFYQDGIKISATMAFDGFYYENGSISHHYDEAFIPRSMLEDFIAIDTSYVDYEFPTEYSSGDIQATYSGSAENGYKLIYDNGEIKMNLTFIPKVPVTIDDAQTPLRFISLEQAYGKLTGTITINSTTYTIICSDAYIDHMMPMTDGYGWSMDSHGWEWIEVTTKNYQGIFYGVRSLEDGYDSYYYKHIILLDKRTGRILADYAGDNVTVTERNWISEDDLGLIRPEKVIITAPGLK
ncbi:hypothetical protein [Methanomethylovorans hollandica]|uniref:hypothetical protein n=1 Tax=Methanomethylovorans hollandica TaxID=101192 RepID=UPI0006629772|nr:hypothetical protein [Methanomethylovorans hollandica]